MTIKVDPHFGIGCTPSPKKVPEMTSAKLKKLLQIAKDMDVAEMKIGDIEVKFFKQINMPGQSVVEAQKIIMGDEDGDPTSADAPQSLKDSLNTHLDAKSPSRSEQEHINDLMWSAD